MSGHQQTIYTIHESQLNNNGNNGQRSSGGANGNDILIDTSSIPLQQQAPLPPMQHQHQLQASALQPFDSVAVTSQPSAGSSSHRVAPENQAVVYSVHPVFSLLDQHDALLIRQRADCTSTCCGFESVNTYAVRGKDGAPILKAIETSNCLERCCFEGNREYNLALVQGDEVVARIRKPYRVSRFCCYSNAVRIESPEDNPIGYIRQQFTLFGHPKYAVFDCHQPPKSPSFFLESSTCRFCFTPCLCTCVCGNQRFRIISAESRKEVGCISRRWSTDRDQDDDDDGDRVDQPEQVSIEEATCSAAEEQLASGGRQLFGIKFTQHNLEARHKVLLLSACFMMDFFYFENDRRRRKLASC